LVGQICAGYGLVLALIFFTPVTDWFAYGLRIDEEAPRGDAIVVLSAWATAAGELNESGLRRALAAARLYVAGVSTQVVVTGRRPLDDGEGDALQASVQVLEQLGVPRERILIEEHSRNTHESGVNVGRLAHLRGWSRVVLVTDALHMRRATRVFAHEGLPVSPVSTMTWMVGGAQPAIRLEKLGAILHEYFGLAYYRARGWI
jgi:uncharacterized SAM-binding protein YcdF (DUF218 family)